MEDNMEQLQYPTGRYQKPEGYDPQQVQGWIGAIAALPGWLDVVIENLDEPQLLTPYRPGGWTVQQVIHHIADSHINAYVRLKLAMTEDNPTIKPYLENEWAKLPDTDALPVNISITLLHALHRRMVVVLQSMSEADFRRTYYHPEYQRDVPLWEMTGMYAWHGRHHMEHVRQLRVRMGW